jgi:hypothetical protein
MPLCRHCERNLKYWQLTCRACHFKTWRLPQLTLLAIGILIVIGLIVLIFTHEVI